MFLHYTFLFVLFFSSFAIATEVTLKPYGGYEKKFYLPFPYYQKAQDDHFVFLDQGSYHVFDLEEDKKDVAIIGPLNPCIGIVVTDGKKAIAFHKHPCGAILLKIKGCSDKIMEESIEGIIKTHLSLDNASNLFARLFSAHDNVVWEGKDKEDCLFAHDNKSHQEALRDVISFLKTLGFQKQHIVAQLYQLQDSKEKTRYSAAELGLYSTAENTVSISMNDFFTTISKPKQGTTKAIKFSSFGLIKENVLELDLKHEIIKDMESLQIHICKLSHLHPLLTLSFIGYMAKYQEMIDTQNKKNYQREFKVEREVFLGVGLDRQKKHSNYSSLPFFQK